uniref:(California timema) hypothetical protein n=1 Tax=Timema californicum TaxID=61474 RepID=A0A7R9JD46_TIMCA|nr:unnamed protein product [Timema californicum]
MVREGDEGWRRLRDGDWNLDSREEGVCKGKNDTYRDVRTSTMRYSLLLLLVTSVVTFNVLKLLFMSWFPDLMMNLSLGLLTVVLADLLVKLAANVLPRKLLPDLENKAVFITGAGAQELKSDTSSRLHIVPLDVTKEKDVDKAVEYVKSSQGNQGLWAVINNAGVLALGETELMPVEIFQRIIEVNTIGSVRVTKAFLPLVRKSKGRLVFTASSAGKTTPQGRITFPGLVPYSMSKHAIVSFIDGLRREMRKWSVTVHGIEPMMYRTPMANLESHKIFLNLQWCTLPEETRRLYGDSYVDRFMDISATLLTYLEHKPLPATFPPTISSLSTIAQSSSLSTIAKSSPLSPP